VLRTSKRHLNEIGETYFEHLHAAFRIARLLAKASAACALHAIVPGACTRTASGCVGQVQDILVSRITAATNEPPESETRLAA
jgi:hypothetical protein